MIENKKPDIPIGKWVKCPNCKEILYKEDVKDDMLFILLILLLIT